MLQQLQYSTDQKIARNDAIALKRVKHRNGGTSGYVRSFERWNNKRFPCKKQ
jgi:hypothetical protein